MTGAAGAYFGKYMNGHNSTPEYIAPGWERWVTSVHRAGQPFMFNMDWEGPRGERGP